jgi:hypothetical protein
MEDVAGALSKNERLTLLRLLKKSRYLRLQNFHPMIG